MDFNKFDESIGVEGYYRLIRDKFFPNSTPLSFDVATFRTEERYYRKGTLFSRVRKLSKTDINRFLNGSIKLNDFYPPRPHIFNIPEGRFNAKNEATFYLADHPFVAMKECNISTGDYFLLSYFSLPKDMCFMHLEDNVDPLSSLLYRLLKAQDTRFYSVINLVYSNLLTFEKHDGIAYDSIKVDKNHIEFDSWGKINSTTNLAISNQKIKSFKFELSWLMQCRDDYIPVQQSIYYPTSNKKRKNITRLNYRDNKRKFISISNKFSDKLLDISKKNRLLTNNGILKIPHETPFKIVSKLDG
ncbi:RES domain-containing protein [Klebsiella variicola]|uniref:RES domain-containing protein n=2 Tax=Klebsiella variicola TaxID=244366 RepID=UPI00295F4EEB|nr:RES domain-containing protein [Klebsiella variicola]MDW0346197.1 RES domain-containing protein [Klebsiella variicola]